MLLTKPRGLLSLIFSSLLLLACRPQAVPVDTMNLQQLQKLSHNTVKRANEGINSIRYAALQETALTIGAQGGLAERSRQINQVLEKHAKTLEHNFNFDGLILEHNVLPPVLEQGNDTLNLASQDTIRLADKVYRILRQARFVTTPPNWREYLWLQYTKPSAPDPSLLPKNNQENEVWQFHVQQGWENGMQQANQIYQDNISRLRRDYNGMLLYRELLNQNMVSAPYVAGTQLGVTGDANQMRINDQVLRITALPKLQTNSKTWNPVVIKEPPPLPRSLQLLEKGVMDDYKK
jgi:defect-in-organelle-trafficking protein DotC